LHPGPAPVGIRRQVDRRDGLATRDMKGSKTVTATTATVRVIGILIAGHGSENGRRTI
jgi:hypothetical protein